MSTIYNTISGYTLTGTADADSIDNLGNNVIISTNGGNDTVTNYSSNNSLATGKNVIIETGAGDDSIANHGANFSIDGDSGDDVINNSSYGTRASISGATGNDSIRNSGTFAIINGDDGNDTIINTNLGANSTIIGGEGNDYLITSGANNVFINGGAGADTIYSTGIAQGVTISGGNGNDTLVGDTVNTYGVIYQYENGAGNDRIYNYSSNDTISISGSANYQTVTSGNSVTVSLTSGSITLVNAKDKTLNIKGGTYGGGETESTLPVGLSIKGEVLTASTAFTGNSIYHSTYGVKTVDASALSRGIYIYGDAQNNSIKGGTGADTISGAGGNDTVSLGSGNDVYIYSSGYDLIQDYTSGQDKIWFSSNIYITSSSISGSDVVLNISNGGKITVKGGKNKQITVNSKNNETTRIYGQYSINSAGTAITLNSDFSGDLNSYNYDSSVVTINASKTAKGGWIYGNAQNNYIDGGTGADTIIGQDGNDSIWGGKGNDSLIGNSGADRLYGQAGNDILNGGADNDYIDGGEDNDYALGGTGNDTIWGSSGNDVLYGEDGNDFLGGEAGNDYLSGNSGNDTLTGGTGNDTLYGGLENDVFIYSSGDDVIADFNNINDKISLSGASITASSVKGSDLVLTTNNGSLTLKNYKNLEVTIGSSIYYNNVVYDSKKTSATVSAGFTGDLKAADYASSVKNIYAGKVTKGIGIYGNTSANSIFGSAYNDTLYGSAGNDTLRGNAGNDKLYGNEGNDVLDGDSGNDTLYGGAGNDTFRYYNNEGNDVIADFESGDKIYVANTTVSSASLKSSDMVFKIGSNTLTVKNGKDKEIAIGDYIYYNNLIYDSKKTRVTVPSSFTGSLTADAYASSIYFIDASTTSKGVRLYGNAQNNYIYGGRGADLISGSGGNDYLYGGSGNDTLYGGTGNDVLYGQAGNDFFDGYGGNDTLYGGAGNDTFRYYGTEGNDVIADYETGDKIYIPTATISSASVKGSDIVYTVGSGTLTVKNGKDKEIAIGDNIYYNNVIYDSKKTRMSLPSNFSGTLKASDYSSSVKSIFAYNVTKGFALYGNAQNNDIYGGSGADTIFGGTGNDWIVGGAGNDKLYGEAGNDTLFGGYGTNTLYGGAGNDVFVYNTDTPGKDVIADFADGDKISITGSNSTIISSVNFNGTDTTFNIGTGSVVVKSSKDKEIVLGDKIYYNNLIYNSGKTAVTLGTDFSGTLKTADYSSSVKTIFAYNVAKDIVINGNSNANTIYGSGRNKNTIYGGTGNDLIYGYSGNDMLWGDSGNDSLYSGLGNDFLRGGTGNDYISGGEGNDTLDGDTGNDTLYGGNGNDIFRYYGGEGNDVIGDYATGDKIQLVNATISAASVKGSDIVYTIGSESLTVKNGKDKEIVIDDKTYYNNLVYSSNKATVTVGAGFTGTLNSSDYDSTVKVIWARPLSNNVNIVGNSNANTIYGSTNTNTINGGAGNDFIYGGNGNDSLFGGAGNDTLTGLNGKDAIYGGEGNDYITGVADDDFLNGNGGNDLIFGGAGNDTLWGDAGNDTLYGDSGNDVFCFSANNGADVIGDYEEGDTIKLYGTASISSVSVKSSDVVYKLGSNTITVKNGKGKAITVTDSNGNTTTRTYSSGVSARILVDLIEDTNFITDENNLDSITESKFSVTDIQDYKTENLAQESTILAYSNEK